MNTREPDLTQRLCLGPESETVDRESNTSHRSSLASFTQAHDEEPINNKKREPLSLSTTSCNSLLKQSLETSSLHSVAFNNNKSNSSLTSGLESAFAGGLRTNSPVFNAPMREPKKCKKNIQSVPDNNYQPVQDSLYAPRSSPPHSSTEDESGFSSMNSFQEVGLPLVSPSPTPSYLLSNNHSKQNSFYPESRFSSSTNGETSIVQPNSYRVSNYQEIGLPLVDHSIRMKMAPNHRRWSSSPADALTQFSKQSASFCGTGETLKVLWV